MYDMSTPQPQRGPQFHLWSSMMRHFQCWSLQEGPRRTAGQFSHEPMLRSSFSQVFSKSGLPVVAGPSFLLLLYRKTFSICFLGLFSLSILCEDSFLACSEFLWQWPGFMFSSVYDVVLFDFFQCSRASDTQGTFPALGWEQPVAYTSSWL